MTENITGRDGQIIRKALAYAIEAIGRLPDRWQEKSDQDDMILLLNALTEQPDYYRMRARAVLERRGVTVEDGNLALAAREPGVVVSMRDEC